MTSSFGASTTTADGVPLTLTLTLLENASGCVPLAVSQVALTDAARSTPPRATKPAPEFPEHHTEIGQRIRRGRRLYRLATMSGSVTGGYTPGLNVTI